MFIIMTTSIPSYLSPVNEIGLGILSETTQNKLGSSVS